MCDAYYTCWHTVASNTHNDILIAVDTMNASVLIMILAGPAIHAQLGSLAC